MIARAFSAESCAGRRWFAVLVGLAGFAYEPWVAAHAPPLATDIGWLAGSSGERVLVRTNRGLIVGAADGTSFGIVCNDAFGASLAEVPPLAPTGDGRVLVGTYDLGLLRSDPTLCDFDPVDVGKAPMIPVALSAGASGAIQALLLPLDGSDGGLFESRDHGKSFQLVSTLAGAPSALVSASSDPARLYVTLTTSVANDTSTALLVSDDGGRHFSERAVELDAIELRAYVIAVDPNNRDRVLLRTQGRDRTSPERLLLSDDAGKAFRAVVNAAGPLSALFGQDGNVWAGTLDGLLRSRDGGATFDAATQSDLTRVGCLAEHAGKLLVCGFSNGEFGVRVSHDRGQTFDWFLRFPDVSTRAACSSASDEAQSCGAAFDDWTLEQQGAGVEPTAPSSPKPSSRSSAKPNSASCQLARASERSSVALLGLALLGLLRRHRSRDG